MFECNQDTNLLYQALVSAAKENSGSLQKLGDLKGKIFNIITRSLKTIIDHNINVIIESSAYSLKKYCEVDLHINQRLHAAVFFNTLRSCSITCDSADAFYGLVSHGWPVMDFEFYVELNYKQKWSDFFIKCASQLPEDILITVIKYILCIPLPDHLQYYSWHLILQTVILKLLKVPVDNIPECTFDFDFEIKGSDPSSKNVLDGDNAENSKEITEDSNLVHGKVILSVKDVFNLLCDSLLVDVKLLHDTDLIKVLLHAAKTFTKHKHRFCNKELLKIYEILDECLRLNVNADMLKIAINDDTCVEVDCGYATAAWNIPVNYLVLIINYYYFSLSPEEVLNLKNILECSEIPYFFPVILRDISPYTKNNFYQHNDQYLELLYKVVLLNFEGAPYAAEILLSNPTLLDKDETLNILEENYCAVDIVNIYPMILESILAVKSVDIKIRLLKFFYKVLSINSIENYNEVLKYILLSYGFTKKFQLPDYEEQLASLVRQASDKRVEENVLLSFFVQSLKSTLKCVIEEVLVQGEDGKPLIKALKLIPEACICFKGCNDTAPLIEILAEYFEGNKLQAHESKNFANLFQFLMEVHLETEILYVDSFLKKCIIPSLKKFDSTDCILDCLSVIMNQLVGKEAALKEKSLSENPEALSDRDFDISSETLKALVIAIAQLISSSIESGSGRLKESLILVLDTLESYQTYTDILNDYDKVELQTSFAELNEAVKVYGKEFLPIDIGFENFSLSTLWLWSCKTTDFTFMDERFTKEAITYPELLNMFIQLMPHFTTEEWRYTVNLSEKLSKYSYFIEDVIQYLDMPFKISDNERNLYAVISCFINSLHFTLTDKIEESVYTCTCFCNSLMKILKKDEIFSPGLVMTVFLDLCYLMKCINPNIISTFSSVLLSLKDRLPSPVDKSTESVYQTLIYVTFRCLPASSEKIAVLKTIKGVE